MKQCALELCTPTPTVVASSRNTASSEVSLPVSSRKKRGRVVEYVDFRAGYSASADIILDKRKNTLAILERDLLFEDNGKVYVEQEINIQEFEKKYVEVGLSDGINIEILNGIDTSSKIKVQGTAL